MDLLPKLLVLQQPLLTRSSLDALTSLCSIDASRGFGAKHLGRLLSSMLDSDGVWESSDSNVLLSLLSFTESCILRWGSLFQVIGIGLKKLRICFCTSHAESA